MAAIEILQLLVQKSWKWVKIIYFCDVTEGKKVTAGYRIKKLMGKS